MDRYERLRHVADGFFDAATEPARWANVLDQLAGCLGAVGADLHLLRDDGLLGNYMGAQPPEVLAEYTARFLDREPRSLGLKRAPAGAVLTDFDLADTHTRRTHDYYADFLPRSGLGHCIAAVPINDGRRRAYLGVHLGRKAAPPSAQTVALVASVQPRLARAVAVQMRLAAAEIDGALQAAALERLALGVLILDARGQVLLANAMAEALCGKGRALRLVHGRLTCTDGACAARLQALVQHALARQDLRGGGVLVRCPDGELLGVTVDPCGEALQAATGARALVFLAPLRATAPGRHQALARAMFRFTASEARVALGLARGESLQQVAARLGLAYESVRFTLKRVYDKAGVHKQGELVALLNAALPPLRDTAADLAPDAPAAGTAVPDPAKVS